MSTDSVNLNDNIFQFDNVLTALNYLLEEVETRKNEVLNDDKIDNLVVERMNTREFKDNLISRIRNHYGSDLYRDIAFIIMEKIDADIEEFINDRVDDRLRFLGAKFPETVDS